MEPPPLALEAEQTHLLADVGPTLQKWAEAVQDTRQFARWMKASPDVDLGPDSHWRAVHSRLANCAGFLEFRKVLSGPLAGVSRLHAATFCQHRTICRMCAIRRSSKILQAYVPKLREVCRKLPQRGRLVFVTLTVRDGADLGDRLQELQDGLSALVKARSNSQGRVGRFEALRPIAGGVFSVEMKRGEGSKLWHPHAHGLLVCDKPLDFSAFKRCWWNLLGYSAVSWLKNVKHAEEGGLIGGALETFKYATKFSDLGPQDRLDVYGAAFGRRLLRSFGCLRDVVVPEDLADAPLDWDALEWISLLLRYRNGSFVPSTPVREALFDAWNRGAIIGGSGS